MKIDTQNAIAIEIPNNRLYILYYNIYKISNLQRIIELINDKNVVLSSEFIH